MIPLRDLNPTQTRPVVTAALIAVCSAIFLFVQPHDGGIDEARFNFQTAAIPCEVVRNQALTATEVALTVEEGDDTACTRDSEAPPAFPGKNVLAAVLFSMFLHGGFLHLAGNMLFLWIFGNNIEDSRGRVQYVAFYLIAGLVATLAHIAVQPTSTVPMVGASGAIAGVMGAYLVLYPDAPIRSLITLGFFVLFRDIAAKWLLGIWFVTQFFLGSGSGVAWMAHVGGFVFGVLVGLVWRARAGPGRVAQTWGEPTAY